MRTHGQIASGLTNLSRKFTHDVWAGRVVDIMRVIPDNRVRIGRNGLVVGTYGRKKGSKMSETARAAILCSLISLMFGVLIGMSTPTARNHKISSRPPDIVDTRTMIPLREEYRLIRCASENCYTIAWRNRYSDRVGEWVDVMDPKYPIFKKKYASSDKALDEAKKRMSYDLISQLNKIVDEKYNQQVQKQYPPIDLQ